MLSYRHSYHAGNFADVLKHIVLLEIAAHLLKKDKPFDYIETHAGAGLYDLDSFEANKLAEFKRGVGLLNSLDYPELVSYFELIESVNRVPGKLEHYPGSPYFALSMLRQNDRAHLFELHGKDFKTLETLVSQEPRFAAATQIHNSDGYAGLLRLLPPSSRRALVLIDPSYEVKSEYDQVVDEVIKAQRKFATGVFAIWYPVVERQRIQQLESKLIGSGIRNIQLYELAVKADSDERGMTSSGMIVINPPWNLFEKMMTLLPKLTGELKQESSAFSRCEILVAE